MDPSTDTPTLATTDMSPPITTTSNENTSHNMNDTATLVSKVAERLRFFFSNANLRGDKFLQDLLLVTSPPPPSSSTEDGKETTTTTPFVPITTLLTFKTIQQYTTDPSLLVQAVQQDSYCQQHLLLNPEATAIGRRDPFTKEQLEFDPVPVSLKVGNLPTQGSFQKDNVEFTVTRDQVQEIFASQYGSVAMVKMIHFFKQGKRIATGKALIEFEHVEDYEKAVQDLCILEEEEKGEEGTETKPKRILRMGDHELKIKTMKQWLEQRKEKRRSRHGRAEESSHQKDMEEDDSPKEEVKFELDWKPGCIVSLFTIPEGCDRETLIRVARDFMGKEVEVWADYSRGQKDGKIRFKEPQEKMAEFVAGLNDGTVLIGGSKVESASILQGTEEEEYYKNFIAYKKKQLQLRLEEKRFKSQRKNTFHRKFDNRPRKKIKTERN